MRPLASPVAARHASLAAPWRRAAAAVVALQAACAQVGPPSGEPAATSPGTAPAAAPQAAPALPFEQQQRDRAQAAQRQGRLAEAELAWEVLSLLRPDVPEYAERLRQTRREIDAAVAERLPRAAAAAKRGEIDAATQAYLGVLALDPQEARAAEALRSLERERVRRNYLGKYSRLTLTRRVNAEGEMQRPDADAFMPPTPGTNSSANSNANGGAPSAVAMAAPTTRGAAVATAPGRTEQARAMARRGDLAAAIALLSPREAGGVPKDNAERVLLADLHVQRAQTLLARDRAAAVADLRRAVQLNASHPRAASQLKELEAAPAASAPGRTAKP